MFALYAKHSKVFLEFCAQWAISSTLAQFSTSFAKPMREIKVTQEKIQMEYFLLYVGSIDPF